MERFIPTIDRAAAAAPRPGPQPTARGRVRRFGTWPAALLGLALLAAQVTMACSVTNAAPAPTAPLATPVPPTQLATLPPAKPAAESGPVAPNQIAIENFSFVPADLNVAVGSTVTWVNRDDAPHTATSSNKLFGSPSLDTDGQFSFTFTQAGIYDYFCAIHPFMTARVIVK